MYKQGMVTIAKSILIFLMVLSLACLVGVRCTEACCGQVIDMYDYKAAPGNINACKGECVTFSGDIYEYYWSGGLNQWPMKVTIEITDVDAIVIATINAAVVATTPPTQSYGVDDDGDGAVDEDQSYPTKGVDDDGDGRVDEDGGYYGDEYADFAFEAEWCGTDDDGDIVDSGTYSYTITAQAGSMGTASVFGEIVVTGEPCCEDGAEVRMTPRTFNKCRNGRWATAHVTLPEGFDVADICTAYIVSIDGLDVNIEADKVLGDGVVKFDSDEVGDQLPVKEEVEICVEVVLCDENGDPSTVFCSACDTIRVIEEGCAKGKGK